MTNCLSIGRVTRDKWRDKQIKLEESRITVHKTRHVFKSVNKYILRGLITLIRDKYKHVSIAGAVWAVVNYIKQYGCTVIRLRIQVDIWKYSDRILWESENIFLHMGSWDSIRVFKINHINLLNLAGSETSQISETSENLGCWEV